MVAVFSAEQLTDQQLMDVQLMDVQLMDEQLIGNELIDNKLMATQSSPSGNLYITLHPLGCKR